jgi:excisionase family DNA binding protein
MNTNSNETRVRLLTIKQAAAVIEGLTEYRIRQLCRAGELPCIKVGKKYLINEQTLINFIDALDKEGL